jgi:hypothetical protein
MSGFQIFLKKNILVDGPSALRKSGPVNYPVLLTAHCFFSDAVAAPCAAAMEEEK